MTKVATNLNSLTLSLSLSLSHLASTTSSTQECVCFSSWGGGGVLAPTNLVSHYTTSILLRTLNLFKSTCGIWRLEGQVLKARLSCRKIPDSIFWLYYFTPRWLTDAMPCPKKSQKNYTKRKDRTYKRRRRFFYTFLYLLGSTTIPWMREFFLNILTWLNLPVKVSKIR